MKALPLLSFVMFCLFRALSRCHWRYALAFRSSRMDFELNYDGWRALAYIDHGQCRLVSPEWKFIHAIRESLRWNHCRRAGHCCSRWRNRLPGRSGQTPVLRTDAPADGANLLSVWSSLAERPGSHSAFLLVRGSHRGEWIPSTPRARSCGNRCQVGHWPVRAIRYHLGEDQESGLLASGGTSGVLRGEVAGPAWLRRSFDGTAHPQTNA
jgi:hypothetical protein